MRRKHDVTAETAAFAHYGLSPRPRELVLARPELRVRALIEGAGQPLLLLHGLSLGAVHWAPLLARLDDAMAIAIDMPGHGGTDAVDFDGVDLRRWHTQLLVACMDALGLNSAHIVGHSYGGMFGLWAALDEPSRVRSVVSIGTPSIAFGARPDITFRTLARRRLGPLVLRSARPAAVYRAIVATSLGRGAVRAAPAALHHASYKGTRRGGFATTASSYLREQSRGAAASPPRYVLGERELATISRPILIIWGERDTRYQSPKDGARLATAIPGSRFALVPGGHAPYLDAPGRCAELIAPFVGCRLSQAEKAQDLRGGPPM